jgi:adenylate kinase family enzyme
LDIGQNSKPYLICCVLFIVYSQQLALELPRQVKYTVMSGFTTTTPSQAWAILNRHLRDEIAPLRLRELCTDNDRVSSLVAVVNNNESASTRIAASMSRRKTNARGNIRNSRRYVTEGVLVGKLSSGLVNDYDGIIFLDIPFYLCFLRATRRNFMRMLTQEKICGDNRESPASFIYTMFGMSFKHRARQSKYYNLTTEFKAAGHQSVVFQNNEQVNCWLKKQNKKT